jgi:hypothetical protein
MMRRENTCYVRLSFPTRHSIGQCFERIPHLLAPKHPSSSMTFSIAQQLQAQPRRERWNPFCNDSLKLSECSLVALRRAGQNQIYSMDSKRPFDVPNIFSLLSILYQGPLPYTLTVIRCMGPYRHATPGPTNSTIQQSPKHFRTFHITNP